MWTLTEYALHRFVFHWEPKSAVLRRSVFIMHGNHHAVPNDPLRNLMPPVVSLPVAGLFWVGMLALFGSGGPWLFLGFFGGLDRKSGGRGKDGCGRLVLGCSR